MERKIQLTVALVFLAFAGMFLVSCYPSDDVSYADLDLVSTIYDQDKNFTELSTYAMPDTIVHLMDSIDPDNNVDLSRKYDAFILNLIKQNMTDYGWTLIEDPDTSNSPDVVLTVSAMGTKKYSVWYWYPYYWYWYPWYPWYKNSENADWYWYPGYPAYPGYPGGGYVTSYSVGTLIFSMHDMTHIESEQDTIPVIWLSAINGLLGSSSSDVQNRLEDNINEAFKQSPYLKIN